MRNKVEIVLVLQALLHKTGIHHSTRCRVHDCVGVSVFLEESGVDALVNKDVQDLRFIALLVSFHGLDHVSQFTVEHLQSE